MARRAPGLSRCRRQAVLYGVCLVALVSPAGATGAGPTGNAADTDVLANVLSTAYLAKNLSSVCGDQNHWFLEDTKGSSGDGLEFSEHIKSEVLARLSANDASIVVVRAANAARTVSLGMIHVMGEDTDAAETARIAGWCETTAKPLVKGILAQHDIRHDLFERMLSQAKP